MTFEFATAGRIAFGEGAADRLPSVVAGLGGSALVVTGANPARHEALLASLGVAFERFAVSGEPTLDTVRAALDSARGSDVLLAIGGGSAIDTAKAVAVLLTNGGDPEDYLELGGRPRPIVVPSLPVVAVPTTAGTGAEVTANAVLSVPGRAVKASLRSPLMLPRVAVVDPLLTRGCSPAVTAAAGLDALTQCLEPLVSRQATAVTDPLAREGLRQAASGLRAAFTDGQDVEARRAMSLCSLLGGMALANAKLGTVHGFAAVIGGRLPIPHGFACAALLVPVVEANVRALRRDHPSHPALERYRRAATDLTGNPGAGIEQGIDWLRETVAELAVPGLAAAGLRQEDAQDIVAATRSASSTRGNPVELTEEDLLRALHQAM